MLQRENISRRLYSSSGNQEMAFKKTFIKLLSIQVAKFLLAVKAAVKGDVGTKALYSRKRD